MAKTYGTYKDSGIAWIGEIPGEWEVLKNKYTYSFIYSGGTPTASEEKYYSDEGFAFVSISDMSTTEYVKETKKHLTNEGIANKNLKVLPEGTVLFSIYATVGAVSELLIEATISQAILAIGLKKEIDKSYYKYNLKSMKDYIFSQANGNTQFNLNAEKVANFTICFPPLSVQQSISSFLDTKCGEIDSLISIQEEMISELLAYKQSVITEAVTKGLDKKAKMKNSGVEWIGDIPEEWEVRRIKNICIMGPTDDYSHPYESVGYAPMNTIRYGNINAGIIEKSKLSSGLTYFADNDIVMAKVTPCFENGNIAIAKNLHNGCAYGSSELFVFRATNILTEFLFYLLQNEKFKGLCCSTMTGTGGLKRVSPSFVYNSFIPLPPLPVQQAIATYLDEKTSQIDSLIALKQSKIESLKEYKKSIIYEYVTGKKRV